MLMSIGSDYKRFSIPRIDLPLTLPREQSGHALTRRHARTANKVFVAYNSAPDAGDDQLPGDPMIDTQLLGRIPRIEDPDPRVVEAVNELPFAADDRELAVAWARRAVRIDPACAEALLVLGEHAATAIERVALLKEVVAVYKRQVAAGQIEEITSFRDPGAKTVLAALSTLGDELVDVGDREGAKACFWIVAELDVDDRLGEPTDS